MLSLHLPCTPHLVGGRDEAVTAARGGVTETVYLVVSQCQTQHDEAELYRAQVKGKKNRCQVIQAGVEAIKKKSLSCYFCLMVSSKGPLWCGLVTFRGEAAGWKQLNLHLSFYYLCTQWCCRTVLDTQGEGKEYTLDRWPGHTAAGHTFIIY